MLTFIANKLSLRRRRRDSGDASIVTFVIVFPLFFAFLITIVDISCYFNDRTIISQAARNAAREVAIFGGAGTGTQQSPLEAAYASSGYDQQCAPSTAEDVSGKVTAVDPAVWPGSITSTIAKSAYNTSGLTYVPQAGTINSSFTTPVGFSAANQTAIDCQLLATLGVGANNGNSTPGSVGYTTNDTDPANINTGLIQAQINAVTCTPQTTDAIGETTQCYVEWTYLGIPGSFLSFFNVEGQNDVLSGSAESEVNMTGVQLANLPSN